MDVCTLSFLDHPPPASPSLDGLLRAVLPLWPGGDAPLCVLELRFRAHQRAVRGSSARLAVLAMATALLLLRRWLVASIPPPSFVVSLALLALPAVLRPVDAYSPRFLYPMLLCTLAAGYHCLFLGWAGCALLNAALVLGVRAPFPFTFCATLALCLLYLALLLPSTWTTSSSALAAMALSVLHVAAASTSWFLALFAAYSLETVARTSFWILGALKARSDLFSFPPDASDADREVELYDVLPFLDPATAQARDEEGLSYDVDDSRWTPVFISGFHRSGTTFLYDELRRVLPSQVAYLSPYSLLNSAHLLRLHRRGRAKEATQALDHYWQALGVHDRIMDRAAVSALSPPEEYGFVLLREWGFPIPPLHAMMSGRPRVFEALAGIGGHGRDAFYHLCLKLLHVQQPSARVVLMKNPFEYGHEEAVLRLFPRALFVHIERAPLEVVSSMCRMALHHCALQRFDPYFWTLLPRYPRLLLVAGRLQYVLVALAFGVKAARALLFTQCARRYLDCAVWAKEAFHRLPAERVHRVQYAQLMKDPRGQLEAIAHFMDLGDRLDHSALGVMRAERSGAKLMEEVEEHKGWLLRELAKRGLETGKAIGPTDI